MSPFRIAKLVLAGTTIVFMVAAIYISMLVSERQRALGHISHYNVTWSATKAVEELMRLEGAILAYAISRADEEKDEIALRLAILESRVKTSTSGDFRVFTGRSRSGNHRQELRGRSCGAGAHHRPDRIA